MILVDNTKRVEREEEGERRVGVAKFYLLSYNIRCRLLSVGATGRAN